MAKCIVQPEVTETIVKVVKPKTIKLELTEDEAHLILDMTGSALSDTDVMYNLTKDIYTALRISILPEHIYIGKYHGRMKSIQLD